MTMDTLSLTPNTSEINANKFVPKIKQHRGTMSSAQW